MNTLSIKEVFDEQSRLRTLIDQLLLTRAHSLITCVQPELNAFLRVQRWNINETRMHDWQFPGWLVELASRSNANTALTATVRRHDINRHGFTQYEDLCDHLLHLANTWEHVIQIKVAYFTSDNKRIPPSKFKKRTRDASAYLKIYFYAYEYGNPNRRRLT